MYFIHKARLARCFSEMRSIQSTLWPVWAFGESPQPMVFWEDYWGGYEPGPYHYLLNNSDQNLIHKAWRWQCDINASNSIVAYILVGEAKRFIWKRFTHLKFDRSENSRALSPSTFRRRMPSAKCVVFKALKIFRRVLMVSKQQLHAQCKEIDFKHGPTINSLQQKARLTLKHQWWNHVILCSDLGAVT